MSAIANMAEAIGYPEQVPAEATAFVFTADERDIAARESGGRIVLEYVLWREPTEQDELADRVPCELASYAAGRVLREEAVLAWDPARHAAILWQDAPASFPPEKLKRLFEVFSVSCDWWSERLEEATAPEEVFPELMIRP